MRHEFKVKENSKFYDPSVSDSDRCLILRKAFALTKKDKEAREQQQKHYPQETAYYSWISCGAYIESESVVFIGEREREREFLAKAAAGAKNYFNNKGDITFTQGDNKSNHNSGSGNFGASSSGTGFASPVMTGHGNGKPNGNNKNEGFCPHMPGLLGPTEHAKDDDGFGFAQIRGASNGDTLVPQSQPQQQQQQPASYASMQGNDNNFQQQQQQQQQRQQQRQPAIKAPTPILSGQGGGVGGGDDGTGGFMLPPASSAGSSANGGVSLPMLGTGTASAKQAPGNGGGNSSSSSNNKNNNDNMMSLLDPTMAQVLLAAETQPSLYTQVVIPCLIRQIQDKVDSGTATPADVPIQLALKYAQSQLLLLQAEAQQQGQPASDAERDLALAQSKIEFLTLQVTDSHSKLKDSQSQQRADAERATDAERELAVAQAHLQDQKELLDRLSDAESMRLHEEQQRQTAELENSQLCEQIDSLESQLAEAEAKVQSSS